MATTVQFRRANTANTSVFTGAAGELTVDTDKHVVVVHDGTTTGGWPLLGQNSPSISGTITVSGNSSITNTIFIGNSSVNSVINSTSVNIGTLVSVNTSQLKISSSLVNSTSVYVTSNVTIGNATVNNTITSSSITLNSVVLSNTSLIVGNSSVNNTVVVSNTLIANSLLKLGTATDNVVINSSSITLSSTNVITTIQTPTPTQNAGTYALLANGSWYSLSSLSTSAAGANTQIQFNNSASFGADADFTYDYTTNTLGIGNTVVNTSAFYISNGTTNTGISLPTSVQWGGTNQFLHANGSWVAVTPAGSNTSIQYSNNGVISANAGFTYDYSVSTLGIGSNVSLNTSSLKIGNATVNASINSSSINVNSIKVNSNTAYLGSSITSSNGYTWLPNGLMMQWGKVTANNSGGNITFANVFPTQLFSIQFTTNTSTWNSTYTPQLIASNTSTANVRTGNATSTTVFYMAIGL